MLRILLVDDDARFLDALSALLDTMPDAEVVGRARDGLEALDVIGEMDPDVVVMDLDMPRMDGMEATYRLHAVAPRASIVILSGSDESTHAPPSVEAGATAYVRKTHTVDELPAVLAKLEADRA